MVGPFPFSYLSNFVVPFSSCGKSVFLFSVCSRSAGEHDSVFPATESGLARTPAHHPTSGDRQRISQGNVHASPESEGPGDTAFGGSEQAII